MFGIILNKLHPKAKELYNEIKALPDYDESHKYALIMLAQNISVFLQASEAIATFGLVTEYEGKKRPAVYLKIAIDAQIQALKLLQEFGLTPKAKKLLDGVGDNESPLAKFLNAKADNV